MKRYTRASLLGAIACGVAAAVCVFLFLPQRRRPPGPFELHDVTSRTGITFRHTDGSSGRRYIVETVTAGLALFDYDGDGLIDIYFLNGAPLPGTKVDAPPKDALYRNEGDWHFRDVTEEAGVGDPGFGMGVAVGDCDNDGDPDLYVNNCGTNVLYRNNGDGTFTDVTVQAGVGAGRRVGAGTCFLDIEGDGDLDLYVANYVVFDPDNHPERTADGYPFYPGPMDFQPEPDLLYRNNGDGTFADITAQAGVVDSTGTGMGMVAADYDNDGDTDMFVLNDVAANFFFENDGRGRFTEVGLRNGSAFNFDGRALGSMGVDCADYDNDGLLDFFMTSYAGELPALYRNLGEGLLEDVTLVSGAGPSTLPHVKWGVGFVDFDNDADRDLFIACGHLQDNVELYDTTTAYKARNVLLNNLGNGTFADVSDQSGDGLEVKESSRGAAFDDLDNDGDVDTVVLNSRCLPTVLRNDTHHGNHWLQVRLRGTATNRDGVGAHVKVIAGDLVQLAEVHSGRSYHSHYGTQLHFGLGARDHVDRIEVRWLGGATEVRQDFGVDQGVTICERTGRTGSASNVLSRGDGRF
jgi:hypothetical protein